MLYWDDKGFRIHDLGLRGLGFRLWDFKLGLKGFGS